MKWNEENNCLSDEMLQHYIDEELSQNEQIKIEKHLAECEYCSTKFQEKKKLIELLYNGVPSMQDNEITIPAFYPSKRYKPEGQKKTQIYWWSAAAAILILISFFLIKNTDDTEINFEYVYKEMNEEIDANKPWHEQTTTIYILNESGEIIDKIENL